MWCVAHEWVASSAEGLSLRAVVVQRSTGLEEFAPYPKRHWVARRETVVRGWGRWPHTGLRYQDSAFEQSDLEPRLLAKLRPAFTDVPPGSLPSPCASEACA